MYSEALRPGSALGPYPERDHARRNPFEATFHNVLGGLRRWSLNHTRHANQFVSQVNAACAKLENLSDGRFKQRVDELRRQIGRAGLDQTRAVEGFALVREAASRVPGAAVRTR